MCGSGSLVVLPAWGLLGLLVALPLYAWLAHRRDLPHAVIVGAIVYLDVLLSLTFLPLPLPPYDVIDPNCPFIYTRPFGTIAHALGRGAGSPEMEFLVGNIAAFVPVGVLWPLLQPGPRAFARALLAGFLLSLAIEAGQLVVSLLIGFPYRQADVDDLILNTLGAGAGYVLLAGTRGLAKALAPPARLE